jgi:hypothetical protein
MTKKFPSLTADVMGFPVFLKQRTGVTVNSILVVSGTNRQNIAHDYLRAAPFIITQKCTLDRVGIRVTGAGAGGTLVRVGIYDDDGNFYPRNLILDAGTLDGTAVGVDLITISLTLQPGIYWLVINHNDATDALDIQAPNTSPLFPYISSEYSGNVGWDIVSIYGAMPSAFPAGASAGYVIPIPFYRISAYKSATFP